MPYRVVLGVSGSVAAYRAADLARELMRRGCTVSVCLTDAAQQFVTPALFEALTGQPCLIDTFDEPVRGRMAHIDWAREADLVMVAPATANTLAGLASGEGRDMLTTLALATHAPVVVAPAMNPSMYGHPATQEALQVLRARGVLVVEPAVGDVACGENGQGKLASVPALVEAAMGVIQRGRWLSGQTILITGGPTHEPMDDVRFLGNRSSGKMAVALAHAATLCGASVHLVLGPSEVVVPASIRLDRVQTANEMLNATQQVVASADGIIGCAAVADYRPETRWVGKRRRTDEPWTLRLVPNPDILAELVKAKKASAWTIGFAAEPNADTEEARQKLKRKGLDGIVLNDVSRSDIGFGTDDNEVRLLMATGQEATSGVRSKLQIALWIFERLHEFGRLAH